MGVRAWWRRLRASWHADRIGPCCDDDRFPPDYE